MAVLLGWASFEFFTFPYSKSETGLILDHWQFRPASRQALKGLPQKD
jgi:hypothetical protein